MVLSQRSKHLQYVSFVRNHEKNLAYMIRLALGKLELMSYYAVMSTTRDLA